MYEFENVETQGLAQLSGLDKLLPSRDVLRNMQTPPLEKEFLRDHGPPHVDFVDGRTAEELPAAARRFGYPPILKTARGGYDGKAQRSFPCPPTSKPSSSSSARGPSTPPWPGFSQEPIDIVLETSAIVARE